LAVYGLSKDLELNKGARLYVPGETKLVAGDVFLGGSGTGVTDEMIGPATRVFGNTAADTARSLGEYTKHQSQSSSSPFEQGDVQAQRNAIIASNDAPRSDWAEGAPSMSRLLMEQKQSQDAVGNAQNAGVLTGRFDNAPTLAQKTYEQNVRNEAIKNAQWDKSFDYNAYNDSANRSITQQNANTSAGIFPTTSTSQFASSVNKYADQYGVPANLIDAVIGQESGGRNGLTSSAGAQGLMQLMPETAKSLGVTDSNNVDQNIMGGVKYLSQQLNKYGSNELALAAYNAGPGAVDNAIRKAGSSSWSEVSKYLPSETKNYVPSILGKVQTSSGGGKKTVEQQGDNATAMAIEAIQDQAPNMTRSQFNIAMTGIKSTWIRDGADFKVIQDAIDSAVTKDEAATLDIEAARIANAKKYNANKSWWQGSESIE